MSTPDNWNPALPPEVENAFARILYAFLSTGTPLEVRQDDLLLGFQFLLDLLQHAVEARVGRGEMSRKSADETIEIRRAVLGGWWQHCSETIAVNPGDINRSTLIWVQYVLASLVSREIGTTLT